MERTKRIELFATYLNTMAAGVMVAGVVAPAVNVAVSVAPAIFPVAYFAFGGIGLSIVLHLIAQLVLGRVYR